jgi:hypothetical protein
MNQMFIENFKAWDYQQKQIEKKRKNISHKGRKIHNILISGANEKEN